MLRALRRDLTELETKAAETKRRADVRRVEAVREELARLETRGEL